MPSDYGHEQTEKELKKLERKITKEYKQAAKEVNAKFKKFMADFERKDAKMLELLDNGEIDQKGYDDWRRNQLLTGERMKSMYNTLAADLANADKIAAGMINDSLPDVYAINMNYSTYKIENVTGIDTNFTLYDKKTVENLMKDDPKIIPQLSLKQKEKIAKDELWNRKHLVSAVTQGILQGESIPKIAKRLESVANMDRKAAIRNARTYTTAAENKGRMDSYERAEKLKIETNKKWIAALDSRTRVVHRHLDGVSIPWKEKFKMDGYEIEYPGDPSAAGEMIYNCRCTLVDDIKNWPYKDERNTNKMGNKTYEEWKHEKDKPRKTGKTEQTKQAPKKEISKPEIHTENDKSFDLVQTFVKANNVTYRGVTDNETELKTEEIVEKLAGGDMTKGSCASLSLAYVANKLGFDVTDYRGGQSRVCFSRRFNLEAMLDVANAKKEVHKVKREAKDTVKILNDLPKNKEYVLIVGRHAAIVRNTDAGLEYMEMQNATKQGWMPFESEFKTPWGSYKITAEETLASRFGCRKGYRRFAGETIESKATLAAVDTFQPTVEFKELLGYINTDPSKQQKGASGGEK